MLTHTEAAGLGGLVRPTDRDRDQLIFNLEVSALSLQVTLSQGRTSRGPTHPPRGRRQPDNNRNNIKSSKLKQNIGKLFNFGSMRKSVKRSG